MRWKRGTHITDHRRARLLLALWVINRCGWEDEWLGDLSRWGSHTASDEVLSLLFILGFEQAWSLQKQEFWFNFDWWICYFVDEGRRHFFWHVEGSLQDALKIEGSNRFLLKGLRLGSSLFTFSHLRVSCQWDSDGMAEILLRPVKRVCDRWWCLFSHSFRVRWLIVSELRTAPFLFFDHDLGNIDHSALFPLLFLIKILSLVCIQINWLSHNQSFCSNRSVMNAIINTKLFVV